MNAGPTGDDFAHEPVMKQEIVETFRGVPPGVVLDATLGGGGHSEAILDSRDDLRILGLDRDPDALSAATPVACVQAQLGTGAALLGAAAISTSGQAGTDVTELDVPSGTVR